MVTVTSPCPRGNYKTKTKTKYPTASNNDNKTAGNYHIIHTSRKKPKTLFSLSPWKIDRREGEVRATQKLKTISKKNEKLTEKIFHPRHADN